MSNQRRRDRPSPPITHNSSLITACLRHALGSLDEYSQHVVGLPLRPYQLEPGLAIADSVVNRRGLSLTVEMARQAGKNELSAQLEAYLLTLYQRAGGNIVKCCPIQRYQAAG